MKIFVIFGKAKSGKDTVAKMIQKNLINYNLRPCIMHITSPLYTYAKNYFNWDETKEEKPRALLQELGIEIIEQKLNKKYFLLNRLKEDIEILNNFFDTFIIADTRLKKEYDYLKETYPNIVTIKIERNSYESNLTEKEQKHITETEIDSINNFNYIIYNNSKESLKNQVNSIIENEIKGVNYE